MIDTQIIDSKSEYNFKMGNIYIDEDQGNRAISSRILANTALAKNVSIG